MAGRRKNRGSSWNSWNPGWEPSVPLSVEGGLTARSTRGSIGSSWWSKRFIAHLESFGAGSRLTRGRAYARKGQVLSLAVVPGVVTGTVQGSRPAPYEVWITMPILPGRVWSEVEAAIASQALFAAQLLGGELPGELEGIVASAGGVLFPASFGDLVMRCTCPDGAVPCKHLAAAFYLLAESFDDDPFRILLWRGRSREELLAGIRPPATPSAGEGGGVRDDGSPDDVPGPLGAATALSGLPALAVEDQLDRFWVSPVPLPEPAPAPDTPSDLLLRQLPGPPAVLGGAELAAVLGDAYRTLGDPNRALGRRPD